MTLKELNLKQAVYGDIPDSFERCVQMALYRTKEEQPVKRMALRTVALTALIIVALTAVAFAAVTGGLTEWFKSHYDATLPQSAREVLSATEASTLDAGHITFTVSELLCDGKIACLTAEAQLKDGENAILYPDAADPFDRIGEALAQQLNHPQVTAQSTYLDAAKATGLKLYNVSAWMEVADNANVDSEMLDGAVMENGHILLVRMMYFRNTLDAESLPVTIVARVMELNTDTLEFVEDSRQKLTAERSIPIHGVTEARSYAPEGDAALADVFTVTKAEAKKTCAGVYVTVHAKLDEPMTVQDALETGVFLEVLDAQGQPYPTGLSLTGEYLDQDGQPLVWESEEKLEGVQFQMMISVDELPESLIVTDGTAKVTVK